jgi:hypothetical protein
VHAFSTVFVHSSHSGVVCTVCIWFSYKATRIVAEVACEAAPQALLQSLIFVVFVVPTRHTITQCPPPPLHAVLRDRVHGVTALHGVYCRCGPNELTLLSKLPGVGTPTQVRTKELSSIFGAASEADYALADRMTCHALTPCPHLARTVCCMNAVHASLLTGRADLWRVRV